MTRWIDAPYDDDHLTEQFVFAVQRLVFRPSQGNPNCEMVLAAIGVHPADHFNSVSLVIWASFVKGDKDKVRALIDHLIGTIPAAAETLEPFLTAKGAPSSADEDWYVIPPDAEQSRIVYGERRRAVVDRHNLRNTLPLMVGESPPPVLSIQPSNLKGKSHGCALIGPVVEAANQKRKANGTPEIDVRVLDIASAFPLRKFRIVSARMVAVFLSDLFKLDRDYSMVLNLTEATRTARELAGVFANRFAELAETTPAPRVLVIDGLDRENVQSEIHAFVAQIALDAMQSKLPDLRLITTGIEEGFAPAVVKDMETDELIAVTTGDIETFFIEIGNHVGQPLEPTEISDLLDKTLAKSELRDLKLLEEVLLDVADEWFGP